jgi:hypothetical protein
MTSIKFTHNVTKTFKSILFHRIFIINFKGEERGLLTHMLKYLERESEYRGK